jgi:hypothetical protein
MSPGGAREEGWEGSHSSGRTSLRAIQFWKTERISLVLSSKEDGSGRTDELVRVGGVVSLSDDIGGRRRTSNEHGTVGKEEGGRVVETGNGAVLESRVPAGAEGLGGADSASTSSVLWLETGEQGETHL